MPGIGAIFTALVGWACRQEEVWRAGRDLFLPVPARCSLCQCPLPPPAMPWPGGADRLRQVFCRECLVRLPYVRPPVCRQCGRPCRGSLLCRMCRAGICGIAGRSAAVYTGLVQEMVTSCKFKGERHLGVPLGELAGMAAWQAVYRWPVSALVPLPLHAERLVDRGYNQSLLLAERAAQSLRRPVWPAVLIRERTTAPQSGLRLRERVQNVMNAFTVPHPAVVAGKRLLLVDDVLTTGATVTAAAQALLQAGALEVRFATAAVAVSLKDVRLAELQSYGDPT